MGIFDWMKAKRGRKQPEREGSDLAVSRWKNAPMRRGTVELLTAYKEMPWLRTCVDTVANGVADVEWKVVRRVDADRRPVKDFSLQFGTSKSRWKSLKTLKSAGLVEEVPDHPLLRLLLDPNDYMTGRALAKLVEVHKSLVGEAFLVVEKRGPVPVGLWPVPPSWVQRLPDMQEPPERRFYTLSVAGKVRDLPADQVIPLRDLDPDDPMGRGIGPGFALGDELESDEYAARFVKNSFFNNMLPAAIVSIETEKGGGQGLKEQAIRFKEELRREHQGADNAGKLLITSGKVSAERLDTTFRDMNLVELRKFLMSFVRMTYSIPPEVVGDVTNSNRATADASRAILAEQAIVPRAEFMRTELQMRLMPLFGDESAVLVYESPVPEDRVHVLNVMSKMPQAFSFDEWREIAGRQPDPNLKGYPLPLPGQKPEDATQPDGDEAPKDDKKPPADEDDEEKLIPADWATKPLR